MFDCFVPFFIWFWWGDIIWCVLSEPEGFATSQINLRNYQHKLCHVIKSVFVLSLTFDCWSK